MPVIADWRSKRGGMMSGPHVVVELVEAVAARSAFETRLFSSVGQCSTGARLSFSPSSFFTVPHSVQGDRADAWLSSFVSRPLIFVVTLYFVSAAVYHYCARPQPRYPDTLQP